MQQNYVKVGKEIPHRFLFQSVGLLYQYYYSITRARRVFMIKPNKLMNTLKSFFFMLFKTPTTFKNKFNFFSYFFEYYLNNASQLYAPIKGFK